MNDMDRDQELIVWTRAALRALPIATFGQNWQYDSVTALLQILRQLQFNWVKLAGADTTAGWTYERELFLKNLWLSGRSATEISSFLGNVSRNAVIGKAHRLGLQFTEREDRELGIFFEHPSHGFNGEMQETAARGISGLASSLPGENVTHYLGDILYAHDMLRDVYPSMQSDDARRAIDADTQVIKDIEEGVQELCWTPLWPSRHKVLPIDFPNGTEWAFWRRWYIARKAGRPLDVRDKYLSVACEREIASIATDWARDPSANNHEINSIYRSFTNALRSRDAHEGEDEVLFEDASIEKDLKSQNSNGTQFFTSPDGKIDIEEGRGLLQSDQDALDRHQEVRDSAADICSLFERYGLGANAVEPLVLQCERLIEALGNQPSEVRPGLLLPRGERLRQTFASQKVADDLGALPPLPVQFVQSLDVLVSAYNIFVALDPELARRDEARLDPHQPPVTLNAIEARIAIDGAVSSGIATDVVGKNFHEIVDNVNHLDESGRSRRRLIETFRNFTRAAVSRSYGALKTAWKEQRNISHFSSLVRGTISWLSKHQRLIDDLFPEDSTVRRVLQGLLDAFKQ